MTDEDKADRKAARTIKSAPELESVDELAARLGHFHPPPAFGEPRFSRKHAAAAALHGWGAHAYHAGKPMRLSQADYEAALAAVPKGKAHKAALSPHCPHSGGL